MNKNFSSFIPAEIIPKSFIRVMDINEIRQAKDFLRDNGDALLTNYFVDDGLLSDWIGREQIFMLRADRTILLLRTRKGFCHLYFMSTDPKELLDKLSELNAQANFTISVDLIGDVSEIRRCFSQADFERYMTLTRMFRLKNVDTALPADDSWFAETNDIGAIEEIICENMDPLCEQIPDIEEIATAVSNREILIARHEEEPAAILYFKRVGVTVHLKFWATRKKFRGLGYGGLVYKRYVALNADARRFILWVRDDNDAVKKIYQAKGMAFENLHDEVWLSKGKSDMNNSIENNQVAQLKTDINGGGWYHNN